jgi:hypothetical protein
MQQQLVVKSYRSLYAEGKGVTSDHKLILKVAILKCELCLYPLTPFQHPNATPTSKVSIISM